ncbi:MAG: sugar porter family MFS transporter [Gemmatimonadota bacterium]|nr:sugar porter family MFS transporter [Gemmatimonadota bacterium]
MSHEINIQHDGNKGSRGYVLWFSIVASLGGHLLGYDTAVISGAIGFLQTRFQLDPAMTGWSVSCAFIGCIIGVSIAGVLSDRIGRKRVLIISAVLFLVSAVGTALPRNVTEFIIFRMIGGVGVGAASMTSPIYIAEISPAHIRGRMVTVYQFAIVIGIQLVFFVNYFIANQRTEAWNETVGWRWMFGSESLPAALFLVLLFFVPESPRWLAKQGRDKEALEVLSRAGGSSHAREELASINDAISHESGSLAQLFNPGMRIVLVIGLTLAILQQTTGINAILYYAAEIFKNLGSGTDSALLQTVIVGSVNLAFTVIAYWTVDRLGRKLLMLIGCAGMVISLLAFGLAFYFQRTEWWVVIFVLSFIASFALSVGPVVWVVLSEIFPTKIRGRAMAIATVSLWAANTVVAQTFPMMNNNPWLVEKLHHAFPFFLYSALCAVMGLFVLLFVPETKGKSLEEIEQMWGPGK